MTMLRLALLPNRGAVSLTGADARKLLQGLITNDMEKLQNPGEALHAGLLTPQGKILFAFFVIVSGDGFLLETEREQAAALAKRLTFYKLRATVNIEDVSERVATATAWSESEAIKGEQLPSGGIAYRDPRHLSLGWRIVTPVDALPATTATPADYHAHRIALGVPDAQLDYWLGDTYPHEANFDLFHGADFAKGCFVGQEVVARMQHKTIVRKRVVPVEASSDLPADHPDVMMGTVTIGRLGSVSHRNGLVLIRLDRAVEGLDKGEPITAAGITLTLDDEAVMTFRAATAVKSVALKSTEP